MAKRKSFRVVDIVKHFGGELVGDPGVRIQQIATLEKAGPTDLAFLAQPKYLSQLETTRAAAVILSVEARDKSALPRIIVDNPYAYFAKVSAFLNPVAAIKPGKHKTAVIAKTARVAKSASIGAHVVIGSRTQIGERAVIGAGCVIGENVVIGAATRLHAQVTVYDECSIGARCIVHSGVVIGADGFGLAHEDGHWMKIPQIGRVVIGDDVEIGANTTVDRGTLDDTIIEEGVKLDNQIQIAHNVHVGAHTAIAACTGIAGSAKIGRHCTIGGAAMIYGHITIADNINISAGTLVMKSLDKVGTYTGVYPFSDHRRWLKNAAHLRQLDEWVTRMHKLEEKFAKGGKNNE